MGFLDSAVLDNGLSALTGISSPVLHICHTAPLTRANVKRHSIVHTDELSSYQTVNAEGYFHMTVNHGAGEYVSAQGSSVNGIESFWGQLKRSIAGTYIHVSAKHLEKYAKEAEYRFNRRSRPAVMLDELLSTFGPLPERRG